MANLLLGFLSNLAAPNLKAFYERFSDASKDPQYALTQPYKYGVMMIPAAFNQQLSMDMIIDPLFMFLGKEFLNSVTSLGGTNPFNILTLLIRKIEMPDMNTIEEDNSENPFSEFGHLPFPGKFYLPTDNKFKLHFTDTEFSPLDSYFNMWLAQTASQVWCYDDHPYSTAHFMIYPVGESVLFRDSGIGEILVPKQIYVFLRCFPSTIQMPSFDSNAEAGATRFVEFKFSKFFIIPNVLGFLEQLYDAVH